MTSPTNARPNEQAMLNSSFSTEVDCLGYVDGFLIKTVGRKVVVTYPSATTELYSFQQGSTVLYQLTATYTDSGKASISSLERTA